MQFTSVTFLAFFAVAWATHALPFSWRARKRNLVVFSCLFYAAWNPPFVLLLWISTMLDWEVGNRLHRAEKPAHRRALLGLSLAGNLGMLAYFKYGGFALENFAMLVRALGFEYTPPELDIVLPIGISFYTFQTLSYTLDIYYRRLEPCTDFVDYALFVTFFPQLVAGPIVRASEFLPQCERPVKVNGAAFAWGAYLFVLGAFLKSVVADSLLAGHVEEVFTASAVPITRDVWVGTAAFACQIYCDFAGYSLCGIGAAKCLGFELPTNFRFPFGARGFQDFWRRWHISLSTWLRDYVYVPLQTRSGAAEAGFGRYASSILVTWGLIGLWHGATWGFVLWGLASGVFLIVEREVRKWIPDWRVLETMPFQLALSVLTFGLFCTTAPFFRAPTTTRAWEMLGSMYLGASAASEAVLRLWDVRVAVTTIVCLLLGNYWLRDTTLERVAARMHWSVRAALLAVMCLALIFTREGDRAFIYFQF